MPISNIILGPNDQLNFFTSGPSTISVIAGTPPDPIPIPVPPPIPTVQFAGAGASGAESTTPVSIGVTLSQAASVELRVNYAVSGGTALANADYTSIAGTLVFAAGQTSKTITLPITNDAVVENDETVILSLSGPVNCTLGTPNTFTYTILNDDTVPTPATQPIELGVNLETNHDYQRSYYFTDLMKSARLWSGSVGADGWPVGTAEFIIITTDDNCEYVNGVCVSKHGSAQPTITGIYKVQWVGAATLSATNATVSNVTASNGVNYADLTVAANNVNVLVKFTAPSAGSITSNIKVMRPGYAVTTTKVWTDEFKSAIAPFKVLRCMDILITNRVAEDEAEREAQIGADGVLTWAERPSFTQPRWTNIFGVPIEALVLLANETGKDLWLNISDRASADYWQGLALYLKNNLNPACKVYIEYSNEVWNGIFLQFSTNLARANAYTTAETLPSLDEPNQYYAARHYTLLQLINISNTFRSVFGDAAMMTRVRPVFADQNADVGFVISALNWAQRKFAQPPSYYIYAISSAPYSGPLTPDTGTTSDMLEGSNSIFARLNRRVSWSNSENKQAMWFGVAQKHNLAFVGYEGGWDAGQGYTNLDAKIATCYDARAEGMAAAFATQSLAHGMRLFCYFNFCGTYSRFGQWGLSDDVRADYPTPVAKKLKGLRSVALADARDVQLATLDPATSYFGLSTAGTRGNGTGLTGRYYAGTAFAEPPAQTRVDPQLNFTWTPYGSGNPFYRPDITDNATKSFSIRWRGRFLPRVTASHLFELELVGTASVFSINSQNMLLTPAISLTAGVAVPLVIDYMCASVNFQSSGTVRLWLTVGGRKFIIPPSYLLPN